MEFQITFDYLCPFARNANEAVTNGLAEGKDWKVNFRPFCLSQTNEEGDADVFYDAGVSGVRALQWGLAARDVDPDNFHAVHAALFAARHDEGLDIRDETVIRSAIAGAGADVEAIAAAVASGEAARRLQAEHEDLRERWGVFGVPTFISGEEAVFVRLMGRGDVEGVDRVLSMLEWTGLNEFKRTRVPR